MDRRKLSKEGGRMTIEVTTGATNVASTQNYFKTNSAIINNSSKEDANRIASGSGIKADSQDSVELSSSFKYEETEKNGTDALKKQIEDSNKDIQSVNKDLQVQYAEDIGRIAVKVVDRNTGKVIKEIPSEEMLDFVRKMKETIGNLFDKQG